MKLTTVHTEKEYILYDMRCGGSAGSRVMFG